MVWTAHCAYRSRRSVLVWAAALLLCVHPAWAARYLGGIITSNGHMGLVEVRRPNFHGTDAVVKSTFRCHGYLCYSGLGRFFADNTSGTSTGSFVFLARGPHGEKIPIRTCTFSMSYTTQFSCSLGGTFTCDGASALNSGEIYFIDFLCGCPIDTGACNGS